jgi:hypothetical protein
MGLLVWLTGGFNVAEARGRVNKKNSQDIMPIEIDSRDLDCSC